MSFWVRIGKQIWAGSMIALFLFAVVGVAAANPINLALTGRATQSSDWPPWPTNLEAINAIDGNTDGDIYHGSVTHTLPELAWWQVDLGGLFDLDQIVLWNRTDCCSDRLNNFSVSVLDSSHTTVWTNDFFTGSGYPDPSLIIALPDNLLGQVVQVRLNTVNYLSLAEVQVFGAVPTAVPEPVTTLLLGSGLLALVFFPWKKRNN
jgi:hypothetical protein